MQAEVVVEMERRPVTVHEAKDVRHVDQCI